MKELNMSAVQSGNPTKTFLDDSILNELKKTFNF